MKINSPAIITSRLLPGFSFPLGVISLCPKTFHIFIDLANGYSCKITDFAPGANHSYQDAFVDVFFFLCCFAEKEPTLQPDNVFPEPIRVWAEEHIDDFYTLVNDMENGVIIFE